jgi:hypothetical protein
LCAPRCDSEHLARRLTLGNQQTFSLTFNVVEAWGFCISLCCTLKGAPVSSGQYSAGVAEGEPPRPRRTSRLIPSILHRSGRRLPFGVRLSSTPQTSATAPHFGHATRQDPEDRIWSRWTGAVWTFRMVTWQKSSNSKLREWVFRRSEFYEPLLQPHASSPEKSLQIRDQDEARPPRVESSSVSRDRERRLKPPSGSGFRSRCRNIRMPANFRPEVRCTAPRTIVR